jgi:hypothetical protein
VEDQTWLENPCKNDDINDINGGFIGEIMGNYKVIVVSSIPMFFVRLRCLKPPL